MTWTSAAPQMPGWYWFRNDRDQQLQIVVLSLNSIDGRGYAIGLNQQGLFSQGLHENYHGQWAGPLEPPEDGK